MSAQKTAEVASQHQIIGNQENQPHDAFERTTHPDAQWFADAGLGLFLHWGLSSVKGQCDLSWGMMNAPHQPSEHVKNYGLPACRANMTPRHYWDQAKDFNPDRYDPHKWMKAAKKAGIQYAVITTKHHEGFAMWPSEYGDFSTKNYMGARDLLADYVKACRDHDIKVGFYYSPPDWYWHRHHMSFNYGADSPPLGLDHEPITLPHLSDEQQAKREDQFNDYVRGQVTELLTRYGKIDIIWFDGSLPRQEETISIDEIRQLQPGILINPRGHGYGDFNTPECRFPTERFGKDQWWELCYVFANGAWGYLNHECYKPMGWLLAELSKVRSWDGNFLPNVGPDGHGELPTAFYHRMDQLAQWMTHSGESVRGTKGCKWPQDCNVPVTCKDNHYYLHLDWLFLDQVTLKDIDPPVSLIHLRTGTPVDFTYENRTLTFTLDKNLK
ncbi:MAG: alpha-L-fucosidase, partial [Phycisphaeraceae bacterium JB051]